MLFRSKAPPDLRESLFLGPIDDHRAYYASMPEAATSYAPNLIPDQPPGISATLIELYRSYERLAEQMMRVFCAALELPEGWFDGMLARHFSIMSCHHYPVLDTPPLPATVTSVFCAASQRCTDATCTTSVSDTKL